MLAAATLTHAALNMAGTSFFKDSNFLHNSLTPLSGQLSYEEKKLKFAPCINYPRGQPVRLLTARQYDDSVQQARGPDRKVEIHEADDYGRLFGDIDKAFSTNEDLQAYLAYAEPQWRAVSTS